jgi:short-subunit dehydrogenase
MTKTRKTVIVTGASQGIAMSLPRGVNVVVELTLSVDANG